MALDEKQQELIRRALEAIRDEIEPLLEQVLVRGDYAEARANGDFAALAGHHAALAEISRRVGERVEKLARERFGASASVLRH